MIYLPQSRREAARRCSSCRSSIGLVLVALVATDNCRSPTARPTARAAVRGRRPLRRRGGLGPAARAGGARAAARRARRPRAQLAERLRELLPRGRFQPVPGRAAQRGGHGPGRERGYVVVGPTTTRRTSPASWAPTTAPRAPPWSPSSPGRSSGPRHTIQFILFDGEESPAARRRRVREEGLRGSRVAARRFATRGRWSCSTSWATSACASRARGTPSPALWERLRRRRRKAGGRSSPTRRTGPVCWTTTSPSCAWACRPST